MRLCWTRAFLLSAQCVIDGFEEERTTKAPEKGCLSILTIRGSKIPRCHLGQTDGSPFDALHAHEVSERNAAAFNSFEQRRFPFQVCDDILTLVAWALGRGEP